MFSEELHGWSVYFFVYVLLWPIKSKCSYTLVLNLLNTRKGAGENFSLAKVMNLMIIFFHPSLFFQIWLCLLRSRSIGAHNKWIPVLMQSKRMREQQSGYKFIHWIVSVVVKFCIVFAALRVLFARTYNEAMRVCAGVFLRQHKIFKLKLYVIINSSTWFVFWMFCSTKFRMDHFIEPKTLNWNLNRKAEDVFARRLLSIAISMALVESSAKILMRQNNYN